MEFTIYGMVRQIILLDQWCYLGYLLGFIILLLDIIKENSLMS